MPGHRLASGARWRASRLLAIGAATTAVASLAAVAATAALAQTIERGSAIVDPRVIERPPVDLPPTVRIPRIERQGGGAIPLQACGITIRVTRRDMTSTCELTDVAVLSQSAGRVSLGSRPVPQQPSTDIVFTLTPQTCLSALTLTGTQSCRFEEVRADGSRLGASFSAEFTLPADGQPTKARSFMLQM